MKTVRNVPDLYIQVGNSYKKCIKHIQNFFNRVKTKLSPVEFVFLKNTWTNFTKWFREAEHDEERTRYILLLMLKGHPLNVLLVRMIKASNELSALKMHFSPLVNVQDNWTSLDRPEAWCLFIVWRVH